MLAILAQAAGYSLVSYLIVAVVVIAALAIFYIFVKASGLPIPAWVFQIISVVVLAVVVILAIKFVSGLG